MTQRTEERLRDAVHKYAETIEPAEDGWARISERTIARHRRPRWQPAIAAAAAAVLAIIVAVAIVRSEDRDGSGVQTPPAGSTSVPSEIVASTEDGRVIVLDTRTGADVRTLADGADAETTIAVTPDGARVFFDRPSRPGSDPPREIVTVATRGGEARRLIGGAGQPAISPDGRLLAFVRYSPRTLAGQPNGLEVVEIPETFEGWTPNVVGDGTAGEAGQQISGLSWAPDSRHLVYTLLSSPQGSYPRVAENTTGIRLDQAPIVAIKDGSDLAGYLGDTGELFGRICVASDEADQRLRVIVIDPQSGLETKGLFRYPSQCGSERLSSDRSGRHILAVGPAGLYRWSEGDKEPTKVANGVTSAVWAPASTAPQDSTATSTTTAPPATTVAPGPDTRPPFVYNLATVFGCIGPKQPTTSALASAIDVPTAEQSGRLASVELVFVDANGIETHRPMTRRAGNDYEAAIGPYAVDGNITWQVVATDQAGNTTNGSGPTVTALSSC